MDERIVIPALVLLEMEIAELKRDTAKTPADKQAAEARLLAVEARARADMKLDPSEWDLDITRGSFNRKP